MKSEHCPECGQTLKAKVFNKTKSIHRPMHKTLYCPSGCYSTVVETPHDKAVRVKGAEYDKKADECAKKYKP